LEHSQITKDLLDWSKRVLSKDKSLFTNI
jgi:hypothetical protein